MRSAILISILGFCSKEATEDANGIVHRLMAKAVNNGNPAKLRRGILTEPPPMPNIPLMKPAKSPMPK
jgi:hypothetical protein